MKRVVLLLLSGVTSTTTLAFDRESYCTDIGHTYAYAAKLRDLGKTQDQVLTMVKPVPRPSDDTEAAKRVTMEVHKAFVRNVFQHAATTPDEFYNSMRKGCIDAASGP